MVWQPPSALPGRGRSIQMMPKPTLLMKRWQAGFDRHRHHRLAGTSAPKVDGRYCEAYIAQPSAYRPIATSKSNRTMLGSGATRGNAHFFESSLNDHLAVRSRHSHLGTSGVGARGRSHRSSYQAFPDLPSDCEAKAEEAAARLTGKLPWLEEEEPLPLPVASPQRRPRRHMSRDAFVTHQRGALPLAGDVSDGEDAYQGSRHPPLQTPRPHCRDSTSYQGSMARPYPNLVSRFSPSGFQHSQLGLDDEQDDNSHGYPGLPPPRCARDDDRRMHNFHTASPGHHMSRASRSVAAKDAWKDDITEMQRDFSPTMRYERKLNMEFTQRPSPRATRDLGYDRHQVEDPSERPTANNRRLSARNESVRQPQQRSSPRVHRCYDRDHVQQMQSLRRARSTTPPRVAGAPRRLAVPPSGAIHQCIAEDPSNWSSDDDFLMRGPPRKRMRHGKESANAPPLAGSRRDWPEHVGLESCRFSVTHRSSEWQQGNSFGGNPFKKTSNRPAQGARPQGLYSPADARKPQTLPMLGFSPAWTS